MKFVIKLKNKEIKLANEKKLFENVSKTFICKLKFGMEYTKKKKKNYKKRSIES